MWYIGLFQAFISDVQFFPYHITHRIHALLFPLRYSQVYPDPATSHKASWVTIISNYFLICTNTKCTEEAIL